MNENINHIAGLKMKRRFYMNIVSVLVFQSLNCELCYVTKIIMKHDKHVTVVD